MVNYLDPLDFKTFRNSDEWQKLIDFSLLEKKRIGWNYPLDYSFIVTEIEKITNLKSKKIIDIGCGPGAVHGYLEDRYGIKIIGVDQKHWEKDYVDYIGDFTDVNFREENNLNEIDIIISSSAFEHNSPKKHQKLLLECKKSLKKDGVLIVTSAANNKKFNTKFRASFQVNLNPTLVEKIYGFNISNLNKYKDILNRYINDSEISIGYKKRFNKDINKLNFLALGATIKKEDIPFKKLSIIEKLYI